MNEGKSKHCIMDFVATITKRDMRDFALRAQRIAAWHKDSTLWAEQIVYFQVIFGIDRIKVLAPQYLQWKEQEPFQSVLERDLKGADTEALRSKHRARKFW